MRPCIYILLLFISHGIYSQSPRIWVVAVGIGHSQSLPKLQAPVKQANTFSNLYTHYQLIDKPILPLTDADATRKAILHTLTETFTNKDKVNTDDLVIFYFSGHGMSVGDKIGICPYDYFDQEQLIHEDTIISIMNKSPAKHKVCFIEACKSDMSKPAPTMNIGGIPERIPGKRVNVYTLSSQDKKHFQALRSNTPPGFVYLTSTKVGKRSYEFPRIGGVFSHFLFEGMKGKADMNKDHILTTTELFEYVQAEVSSLTGGNQVPQINDAGKNLQIPIYVLPRNKPPEAYFTQKKQLGGIPTYFFEGKDGLEIFLYVKVPKELETLELSISGAKTVGLNELEKVPFNHKKEDMYHSIISVPLRMSRYRTRQVEINGKLVDGQTFSTNMELEVILTRRR